MQRAEMVRAGAEQLFVTEKAVDTALCELSTLANALIKMRMEANMSALFGQDVIDGIAQSYSRLSEARSAILQIHSGLDTVKTQMGCRTVMVGTDGDKPGTGGGTGSGSQGRLISVVGHKEEAA